MVDQCQDFFSWAPDQESAVTAYNSWQEKTDKMKEYTAESVRRHELPFKNKWLDYLWEPRD